MYICIQSQAYIQLHMYICKDVHITTRTVSNTYASIYTHIYSTYSHTHMKALIHNHMHYHICNYIYTITLSYKDIFIYNHTHMQSHTQYTFEFESLICHPYFSSEEVRYRELCNITQTLSDEVCI